MSFRIKPYFLLILPGLISCGELGPLTNSGASGTPPTQDVSSLDIDAAQGAEIAIDDTDSEIAGAEISIPPGALAIDTQITVEVGSSLVDTEVGGTLDLGEDNAVTEAGPSVVVLPEDLTNPTQPLQLAIPLTDSGSPLTALNYAVLYKVQKQDGSFFLGLFTNVTQEGNKLRFSTLHFGAFQAITLTTPVTGDREVKSVVPITKKREASQFDGIWTSQCEKKEHYSSEKDSVRSETSHLSLSGGNLIYRGIEFTDELCKKRKKTHQVLAKYKAGDDVSTIPGAKNLDISFEKVFLTLASSIEVEFANSETICDYSDWKVGEPKDISNCDLDSHEDGDQHSEAQQSEEQQNSNGDQNSNQGCERHGGPVVGKTLYTIFKVENNRFFLGAEEDKDTCEQYGDTADNRPVQLEDSFLEKS